VRDQGRLRWSCEIEGRKGHRVRQEGASCQVQSGGWVVVQQKHSYAQPRTLFKLVEVFVLVELSVYIRRASREPPRSSYIILYHLLSSLSLSVVFSFSLKSEIVGAQL
jgi:hypothetical protein